MKLERGSVRALSITFLFACAGSLAAMEPPAAAPQPAAARPDVIILDLAQNGGSELSPAQREAVETALLSMAKAADVILCQDGRPSISDPALEALCAQPDRDLPRLWWKARVVTPRLQGVDFLRLNLDLEAGRKAPAGPAQLMIVAHTPLPPPEGKEAGLLLAKEITASLADLPDLQDWFGALRQRPDLLRPWPSGQAAAAAPRKPAHEEAKPPAPPVAAKAPEPRKKIEVEGKKNEPATQSSSSSFLVREALIGGGFSQGVTGNLRVSATGLGFTPKGGSREEWAIPWRDLQEASKDTGAWDVSNPLVIVDRKGRKRYIARIDEKGNYLPGDAILSAIRQKRSTKSDPSDEEATKLK
jgi:hypothetical protein